MFIAATSKRKEAFWLFIYIAFLHLTWVFSRVLFIPPLQRAIGNPWNMLVEAVFKILLWIVPVIIYSKYVLKTTDVLKYLKLKTHIRQGLLWGLIGSLYPLLLLCSAVFIHKQPLHLSLSSDEWLNQVILVGLFEEIPFRGLLFQQLQAWFGFWQASIFSSIFFVTIHMPIWIVSGQTGTTQLISSCLSVFIVGMVCCYLFKRSNSLWSCILAHSVYDFVTSII